MTYAVERERFQALMESEGMNREISKRILRWATTLQRCEIAAINGDGASKDKNENKRRAQAQSERAERMIREWCKKASCHNNNPAHACDVDPAECLGTFLPIFQGDPRGACIKLRVPSGRTDDMGQTGICVPTRRY